MPTYATKADCVAYTEGLSSTDDALLNRIIERAERQVDRLLRVDFRTAVGDGVKVPDLTRLNSRESEALTRATCAQVEYRVKMGETFFSEPDRGKVSGPDFTVEGSAPDTIGPEVRNELRRGGLLRATVAAV